MICWKFKQFYSSHLILSVVTPNLSLNTYARASIVRLSEPVVIVAARAPSSWSSGCLNWPWLSASLVPLSLFLGRNLFYIEFFFTFLSVVHELDFFSKMCVEVCVHANCHVGQGANVSERVWVSVRAWREIFLLFIFLCTCGYDSVRACRGGYFEMFDVLGGHFRYSTVSSIFPLASLLSSLYWPWDPLSSLEATPVSI